MVTDEIGPEEDRPHGGRIEVQIGDHEKNKGEAEKQTLALHEEQVVYDSDGNSSNFAFLYRGAVFIERKIISVLFIIN